MAENIPNMPGGVIPPKKETGKVQPKKETVRINLPPKPSAAPTIKLPTLPPSGAGTIPLTPGAHAPAAPAAPAPAAPRASAAPVAAKPAAPVPSKAVSRAPSAAPTVSGFDKVLAILVAVACLVAIGSTLFLMLGVDIAEK